MFKLLKIYVSVLFNYIVIISCKKKKINVNRKSTEHIFYVVFRYAFALNKLSRFLFSYIKAEKILLERQICIKNLCLYIPFEIKSKDNMFPLCTKMYH